MAHYNPNYYPGCDEEMPYPQTAEAKPFDFTPHIYEDKRDTYKMLKAQEDEADQKRDEAWEYLKTFSPFPEKASNEFCDAFLAVSREFSYWQNVAIERYAAVLKFERENSPVFKR